MKIKRFFAADIRQAMRMVKEELGADAVIMSNRSVDGGVEIVAARDFDEQVIQNNLKQQRDEERAASRLKRLDIPELGGDEKPSHLLASQRKRSNDAENPIRRNFDQYLGYAEKVQLANVNAQKIASKLKLADKPLGFDHHPEVTPKTDAGTIKLASVAPKTGNNDVKPANNSGVAAEHFMAEMRKEIKELRSMLDNRLSSIPHLPKTAEQPLREELLERLGDCGFSRMLTHKIANRLGSHQQFDLAWLKAQEMLSAVVPIADDDLLDRGGIVALVGATGVGKTTTIAKLAAQFILRHGNRQIALITTDNYRIGAHEQIHTYGRILDIPVRVAADGEQLRQHLDSLADKRLILIDTAGMSQRDMRLAEQVKTLQNEQLPIRSYLVMSAATQYRAALEIIDAFQILAPQATILSKFDEAVGKASALSALIERRLPLSFITNGQQVPEDIYQPEAQALIQQCTRLEDHSQGAHTMNYDGWLAQSHA